MASARMEDDIKSLSELLPELTMFHIPWSIIDQSLDSLLLLIENVIGVLESDFQAKRANTYKEKSLNNAVLKSFVGHLYRYDDRVNFVLPRTTANNSDFLKYIKQRCLAGLKVTDFDHGISCRFIDIHAEQAAPSRTPQKGDEHAPRAGIRDEHQLVPVSFVGDELLRKIQALIDEESKMDSGKMLYFTYNQGKKRGVNDQITYYRIRYNNFVRYDGNQQVWKNRVAGGQFPDTKQHETKLEAVRAMLEAIHGSKVVPEENYEHWNRIEKADLKKRLLEVACLTLEKTEK